MLGFPCLPLGSSDFELALYDGGALVVVVVVVVVVVFVVVPPVLYRAACSSRINLLYASTVTVEREMNVCNDDNEFLMILTVMMIIADNDIDVDDDDDDNDNDDDDYAEQFTKKKAFSHI